MRFTHPAALIEVPPSSGGHVPLKRSERLVVEGLHRIITLSLECFNAWLSPLLPRSRNAAVAPVQEQDPYVESLLRALHGQK